jgi:hypothetical protein
MAPGLAGFKVASDADDQDHSLSMLRRIAEILTQKLEVRFVPNHAA